MTRSILCALAALVFLYAWVTFPDFSAAYVATDAGGNFSDAATAAAGALRLLSLGLGLLAAGCVDWKWVGEWIARTSSPEQADLNVDEAPGAAAL